MGVRTCGTVIRVSRDRPRGSRFIALRVVSALGSSCAATARKGTRSVRLGPARDGNRDGLVVVVPRLRPKLASGRWTIAVTCKYRVGGTAGTALKRVVVTVS